MPTVANAPALAPPRPAVLTAAERTDALAAGRVLLRRAAIAEGTWDAYRTGTATQAQTRRVLERLADTAQERSEDLTHPLVEGGIHRDAWYQRMRRDLVPRYYAAALAGLGTAQLESGSAELADVQHRIARQLGYLRRFQGRLASGVMPLDGRVVPRAGAYGLAVWTLGQEVQRAERRRDGYDEEMAVLGSSRNCGGCLERNAAGWQPIGTLRPLGDSPCGSRCRCSWRYRRRPAA